MLSIEIFKRIINGETYAAVAKSYSCSTARIAQIFFKQGRILKHPRLMDEETRSKISGCYSVMEYRDKKDFWLERLEKYALTLKPKEKIYTEKMQVGGVVIGYRALCYIEDTENTVIPVAIGVIKDIKAKSEADIVRLHRKHGDNFTYGVQVITASKPEIILN